MKSKAIYYLLLGGMLFGFGSCMRDDLDAEAEPIGKGESRVAPKVTVWGRPGDILLINEKPAASKATRSPKSKISSSHGTMKTARSQEAVTGHGSR